MINNKHIKRLILPAILALVITSCEKNEDVPQPSINGVSTPATYSFERNGSSSVSYSGQTERLDQLGEIKSKLKLADAGNQILGTDLLAMYANTNGNGSGNFSFSSTKQLEDKTFSPDVSYFQDILTSAANASNNGANNITAANGTSGLLTRGNNNTILVDENGFEFTQVFEKGIMGATLFYQIANVYTTEEKIGPSVDNTALVDGKNYTKLEHHFDEAFGYFGAPVDYKANYSGSDVVRFWAHYAKEFEANIQLSNPLMNAFKKGRQAIVDNRRDVLDEQVQIINEQLDRLIAACAIHYTNAALNASNNGDRMHVLSELYAFTRSLRYSNPEFRKYTITEIDALVDKYIGTNLWNVTPNGLNSLKDELSSVYNWNAVKDIL